MKPGEKDRLLVLPSNKVTAKHKKNATHCVATKALSVLNKWLNALDNTMTRRSKHLSATWDPQSTQNTTRHSDLKEMIRHSIGPATWNMGVKYGYKRSQREE